MNPFLAKCITKLVKNEYKRHIIYSLLTQKHNNLIGGGESTRF